MLRLNAIRWHTRGLLADTATVAPREWQRVTWQ